MDSPKSDATGLLEGISKDIDSQVRQIEDEAASYVHSRKEGAENKAKEILRAAEESADLQCSSIGKNAESKASIERRKMALLVRDKVIQETLERARTIITEDVKKSDYKSVLMDWIVEAAVGLSVEAATVNASQEELPLITDALLRDAEKEVLKLTGKAVRLKKIESDPLPAQGVVLTAEGGRLAYNNQVSTRFLRAQTRIRKRIHAVLFNEGI